MGLLKMYWEVCTIRIFFFKLMNNFYLLYYFLHTGLHISHHSFPYLQLLFSACFLSFSQFLQAFIIIICIFLLNMFSNNVDNYTGPRLHCTAQNLYSEQCQCLQLTSQEFGTANTHSLRKVQQKMFDKKNLSTQSHWRTNGNSKLQKRV